jgi:hypothetical protein
MPRLSELTMPALGLGSRRGGCGLGQTAVRAVCAPPSIMPQSGIIVCASHHGSGRITHTATTMNDTVRPEMIAA